MSFLERSAVGISITDREIEVVEAGEKRGAPSVVYSARAPLSPSIVENGVIVDSEALAKAFAGALTKAKPEAIAPSKAFCVLPISHTYSGLVYAGGSADAVEAAVGAYIQDTVPLARSDVLFFYAATDIRNEHGETGVFFMATSREVALGWRAFFKARNIEASFVFGPLAGYRALDLPDAEGAVALVDTTDLASTVSIFDAGVPHYSFGRFFAGEDATLVGEVRDAIESVRAAHGKDVHRLVLASTRDDSALKAELEKELALAVAAPAVRVGGHEPFRLATIGAALRGLEGSADGIDPLFSLKEARKLQAPGRSQNDAAGAPTIAADREKRTFRRQLAALGAIVLIGIVLGGVWWFQQEERKKSAEETPAPAAAADADAKPNATSTTTQEAHASSTVEKEAETPEAEEKEKQIAVILETPTGWLNVRGGPGTAYEQVDRITPGDSYTILETSGDWYRIRLSEEKTGWVFSEYVGIE